MILSATVIICRFGAFTTPAKKYLMKTWHTILSSLLLLLLTACQGREEKVVDQSEVGLRPDADLTLLYTTDLHGEMLPYDFLKKRSTPHSLASLYSYVRQVREENPDGTILIDNGDLIEGTTPMYYYNYVGIRERHLASRVMNFMGYDVVNLGNHDLEGGEQIYRSHLRYQFEMPWLCANAIDRRTSHPMFNPYTIIERKGYRIAVLGLVTAETPNWLPPTVIPHLSFQPMLESAMTMVPYIESAEHPDLIIGLFHSGSEEIERSTISGNYHKDGARFVSYMDGSFPVCRSVRGFDIVLIGHDHRTFEDVIVNNWNDSISVLEPASHCRELGRIDIHLSDHRQPNGHVRSECRMSRIPVDSLSVDTTYTRLFAGEIDKINHFLDNPIGVLESRLDGQSGLVGPSNIMNLVHSVQLDVTQADISMASCLSNYNDIGQGALTMRQLFAIYKYENQVQEMWMYGHEVKQFLEYGYGLQFNQMRGPSDHLLSFAIGVDGNVLINEFGPVLATPQYNFTSAGGINYEVDVRKPAGKRVNILSMADGTAFDMNRKYFVVMSSYQAAGGGGFLPKGLGWSAADIRMHTNSTTHHDMRFFINNYLRKYGESNPRPIGTWKVIPEAWWEAAKDRDVELLAPYLRR